jgi:hypothetical protein
MPSFLDGILVRLGPLRPDGTCWRVCGIAPFIKWSNGPKSDMLRNHTPRRRLPRETAPVSRGPVLGPVIRTVRPLKKSGLVGLFERRTDGVCAPENSALGRSLARLIERFPQSPSGVFARFGDKRRSLRSSLRGGYRLAHEPSAPRKAFSFKRARRQTWTVKGSKETVPVPVRKEKARLHRGPFAVPEEGVSPS